MDFYPWLKTLHILLAIVALGANITYGFWLVRAQREPQHLGYALRGVKFLDDRVANPSYGGLLVVGIVLVLMRWEFTDLWIAVAIGLYVLMGVITFIWYAPAQRRQIEVYEAGGPETAEFAELTGRLRALGIALPVIVVTIVVLMVVKPAV